MITLSPTLAPTLRCPRRYTLEKVRRERILAPFAASVLGRRVHERIAHSLQSGQAADTSSFRLPRRLLLREEDDLDALLWRAQESVAFFNARCRPWLGSHGILAVEHFITWEFTRKGQPVRMVGKLDVVLQTANGSLIVDWKTGGLMKCEDQLRFYLALHYRESGETDLCAQAISLSQEKTAEVYWDEEVEGWALSQVDGMLNGLAKVREDPYRATPGQHCTYCPYAHRCEVSEAGERVVLDAETGEVAALTQTLHPDGQERVYG